MSDPLHAPTARWARLAVRVMALLVAFALGAWLFGGDGAPPSPAAGSDGAAEAVTWTCSMHPQVRQPEPGSCPICGMDLIADAAPGAAAPRDAVVLSERARALAELRTTAVTRQIDAAAAVRLLGRIEAAETTRRNVTTWVGGRIDRLLVNTTGERVRRGQVVATLYSPEVYSAHQDLLAAREQARRLAGSTAVTRLAADQALQAARDRLRLLGVSADELEEMAQAETPARSVPVRSPFSGTVIERVVTEGAYVETGATLVRVADLGTLWVQLDAYEGDLARLAVGQPVAVAVEALPGETFDGRVAFIDPTLDPQRRTARVRVEVANRDGRLRPGLFAEAVVQATDADGPVPLVVPDTAPLFTGRRSVVYVEIAHQDGVAYAPRTVRLGPRMGSVYPVVSGLSEGDRVVTRGAFALDADLQIRGGPSMMSQGDDRAAPMVEPVSLSAADRARLAPMLEAYLGVQRALAEDDATAAAAAAEALRAATTAVRLPGSAEAAWAEVSAPLIAHATHVAAAGSIEGARGGFEPLSAAIEGLLQRFGNPLDAPVQVAFCPMALGDAGARWVQQGETIDNAYFGAAMRTCGEVRAAVAPGTFLQAAPGAEPTPLAPHTGHQH